MDSTSYKLKQSLLSDPVLGLPDVTKPLHFFFVDKHKGIA